MWITIALIGYLLLGIVAILDKLILTKSINKPVVYAFYANIVMFGALLAWPFSGELLKGIDWWWAVVSGVAFGFGILTLFLATKDGEATHIAPFNGAVISIAVYWLSAEFLQEKLTTAQIAGIIVLLFASFLLSFEKSAKHKGFHWGFVWAALSGVFFAISHVSAKYLYEIYPFWTGFVWTRATTGLAALPLLFFPAVQNSLLGKNNHKKAKTAGKRHASLIFIVDKILAVVSVVFIQYAAAIGSVTIVNALAGAQYVFMFIAVFLLTKFAPKLFREYFTKREIVVEMIAIVLVVIGSIFFVL
jgi:uncharacterized membrane protein